ncbi:transketolase-like TK C-terminal-containing protein [Acetobacter oeni]|uniref:Transketolase n=1 Tax=Acetobacter oeni TaxID=304077 RepID=A0A511XJM0_9PROT|nr:transketolase [Acetobacter oeni]MBB3883365.1 transketolase [Acetobacter oeni]GEN63146.1 transketolase [Acetobacter oeni]
MTASAAILKQPPVSDSIRSFAFAARKLARELAPAGAGIETIPPALWLIISLLWERALRFDPDHGFWPDRDRFVVSSPRLLPLRLAFMRLAGWKDDERAASSDMPDVTDELYGLAGGLAGQAVASAAGMALAEKILARRFGHSLVDHRTWLVALPDDLHTGVALEAATLAGRFDLSRLTVIVAASSLQNTGRHASDEEETGQILGAFEASGWTTRCVKADDTAGMSAAIMAAQRSRRPSLIFCEPGPNHTQKTESLPPATVWDPTKRRGRAARRAWLRRLSHHAQRAEFERVVAGRQPARLNDDFQRGWTLNPATTMPKTDADLSLIGQGLNGRDILSGLLPELVTLTTGDFGQTSPRRRNDVRPEKAGHHTADRSYFCGHREPAMVGLMNGLALHGGLIPCGLAPLHSVDRMRPALRFAALAGQRLVCSLIESDPDLGACLWQQVEQLASLRAMPNLALFRPAGAREVAAAWISALAWRTGPSVIVFGRQSTLTTQPDTSDYRESDPIDDAETRNGPGCGGYVLEKPSAGDGIRDVTLIASGAEVEIVRQAKALLEQDGLQVALVSLPCWELFTRQDRAYRDLVLGDAPRVAIEAASGFGWERWLGNKGVFIGRDEFGATSVVDALFRNSGISPELIRERVIVLLDTALRTTDPVGGFHH